MIRFQCPHCRRGIKSEDKNAGQEKKCPACRKKITVPSPQEDDLCNQDTVAMTPPPIKTLPPNE